MDGLELKSAHSDGRSVAALSRLYRPSAEGYKVSIEGLCHLDSLEARPVMANFFPAETGVFPLPARNASSAQGDGNRGAIRSKQSKQVRKELASASLKKLLTGTEKASGDDTIKTRKAAVIYPLPTHRSALLPITKKIGSQKRCARTKSSHALRDASGMGCRVFMQKPAQPPRSLGTNGISESFSYRNVQQGRALKAPPPPKCKSGPETAARKRCPAQASPRRPAPQKTNSLLLRPRRRRGFPASSSLKSKVDIKSSALMVDGHFGKHRQVSESLVRVRMSKRAHRCIHLLKSIKRSILNLFL